MVNATKRATAVQAQVADPSRAQVFLDFFAHRNASDWSAAAALFTDDAYFVLNTSNNNVCTYRTPCFGRDSILQNLQAVDAIQTNRCTRVTSIEVMGDIVTGRFESRHDALRRKGIDRILFGFLAQVQDGQILSFYIRPDLADPQTALSQTGQIVGPPIPTPNPPCG